MSTMKSLPPMELLLPETETESSTRLPSVVANVMPFHIEYDGSAPVDSFLVQRSLEQDQDSSEIPNHGFDSLSDIRISAFRGRTIQSTPLPIPKGYTGYLAQVTTRTVTTPSSSTSATATTTESTTTTKNSQPATYRPAKMQKFSMDSDEDDEDQQVDIDDQEKQNENIVEQRRQTTTLESSLQQEPEIRRSIIPIARLENDQIQIWGADGPIDSGDDVLFRTLQEWVGVVVPLLHGP